MTQEQVMQVVRKTYEALDSGTHDSELHTTAFYMEARKELDNLPGIGKEKFFEIVAKAIEEFEKPMVRASYLLSVEEERIKESLIEELYATTPDGPATVREINAIIFSLRGDNPNLRLALPYASPDLQADMRACWPSELRLALPEPDVD